MVIRNVNLFANAGNGTTLHTHCVLIGQREFLVDIFSNVDVDYFWFQQDGATCYTTNETINSRKEMKEIIGRHIFSCRGPAVCLQGHAVQHRWTIFVGL